MKMKSIKRKKENSIYDKGPDSANSYNRRNMEENYIPARASLKKLGIDQNNCHSPSLNRLSKNRSCSRKLLVLDNLNIKYLFSW